MSSDTLIAVKNLSRYYGQFCALREVSFEVKRGQVLGFLGPNGAGKTTTMQLITGTLAPSAGEISVAGFDLLEQPLSAKAALGYLPEHPPLYREMLVSEYLRFCAQLHRLPRAAINKAVQQAVDRCGLGDVFSRLIGNLSKGYQQRIGIAQAIIHNPEVVILDEPTVGLDPIQIREIRNLIRELGKDHSVILSTHILPEVQAVCNHVQIIKNGSLVLNDTIDGLLAQMQSNCLQIGLRRMPKDLQGFMQLPAVETVEQIDTQYLRIRHGQTLNPAEAIAEYAVTHGLGLFELRAEQRSLEQIFVELTCSENLDAADDTLPEVA
jgi:ABC-2 type transport system ATP-binding protein